MGDDIRAGDVVVCVDARTPAKEGWLAPCGIATGRHYRVASLFIDAWGPCLTLEGVEAETVNGGFLVSRFRKIDAADDTFIADMRALKPIPVTA